LGCSANIGTGARALRTLGVVLFAAAFLNHAAVSADDGESARSADPVSQPASHEAPIGVPLRAPGVGPAAEAPASVRNGSGSHLDAPEGQPPPRALGRLSDIANRFSLVELPADKVAGMPDYKRPHHALGMRSSTAEQWLRDQGMETSGCMLPMLRMHTRLQRSGQPNSAIWAYARCDLR